MRGRLAQLMRTRVAGVPVPVLFVVAVAIAAIIIHRRRAAAGKAQDASNLDAATPVGAMANGGYPGQDYSFPTPPGPGDSVDTTGDPIGGVTNPNAGGTTVTGHPTPTTSTAGHHPPKKSPAKSHHPAGHHPRPAPHPKPVHKAAAPPKKTTVHKAPVHPHPKPHPKPKQPKINARGGVGEGPYGPPLPKGTAHKPAHKAPAKKAAPAKKPAHRRPRGMPRNASL